LFHGAWGQRVRQFQLDAAELIAVGHELTDLINEWNRPTPSLIFLKSTLLKLLVQLGRAFPREAGQTGVLFREKVFGAIQSIEQSIATASAFDLKSMADAALLSPDHLSRVFKTQTGLSPEQYYQRRRSQRAALMLLDSRKSVTQIAYELGYSDTAHLSRLFRKLRGMSPRDYRKIYAVSSRL
jgi:AraC family transcriptional regulator